MATTTTEPIGSAEAAGLLHIDRSTLTRWVKSGRIVPALRGSGTTGEMFFNRSDVEALIARQSVSSLETSSGDAA